MSEPTLPPVPRDVTAMVERLRDATGHWPAVEWLPSGRWRLTMANERVRMTYDFKRTRSRWVGATSTLTVNGQRRELAANFQHFVRIWRDPDRELDRRIPEPVPVTEPIEPRPVDTAPAEVRAAHREVAERLGDTATLTVGMGTAEFWTLQVDTGRGLLRLNFAVCRDRCQLSARHLQLLVDGEDKSAMVHGSLDRALALMTRPAHDAAPVSPAVPGAAAAARTNSVEVRRATVIRT